MTQSLSECAFRFTVPLLLATRSKVSFVPIEVASAMSEVVLFAASTYLPLAWACRLITDSVGGGNVVVLFA